MSKASTVLTTGLSVGPDRARSIRARLDEIAAVLQVPRPEVDFAMSSDAKLIAFIYSTNQSFDFVVRGCTRSMISALHKGGGACWAPSAEATAARGLNL